jgi:hypothetical protein
VRLIQPISQGRPAPTGGEAAAGPELGTGGVSFGAQATMRSADGV